MEFEALSIGAVSSRQASISVRTPACGMFHAILSGSALSSTRPKHRVGFCWSCGVLDMLGLERNRGRWRPARRSKNHRAWVFDSQIFFILEGDQFSGFPYLDGGVSSIA